MYIEYLERLEKKLRQIEFSYDEHFLNNYESIIMELVKLFSLLKCDGKCLFFIGNGGSAAIASHMTADYMKNGGMKTVSLYDNSLTTCMGNDYGYPEVFSRPLSFVGKKDDLLIAISSSGNSQNIINAIETAHRNGMIVLTFTGFKENNIIRSIGDYNLYVPIEEYGIVETIHLLVLQHVVDEIFMRDGALL